MFNDFELSNAYTITRYAIFFNMSMKKKNFNTNHIKTGIFDIMIDH